MEQIARAPKNVRIYSPYLTSDVAETVIKAADQTTAQVFTTFKAETFATGGSSIETLRSVFDSQFQIFSVPDLHAKIVITECTFFEDGHRGRASLGKHLHIEDLVDLVRVWSAEHIVITHTSRRTSMDYIREKIDRVIGCDDAHRIHVLMEHRENRKRYENQHNESKECGDDG